PAVVLVEDDPNVAQLLGRCLDLAGCSARTAGSMEAARRILRETEWDLVLLDRALPDGDGVDLCREIRAAHPDRYIMMLTGSASDSDKLAGFQSGADDYVTKPFNVEELLARVRAGLRIVALQKAMRELSLTDDLTGLRNRRALDAEFNVRFETSRRYRRPLSIALVDVDHFKSINDAFGHQTGDAVLREVAGRLRRGTRLTDFASRIGGEEFCVVLPETALFEALQFGEKIRAAVAATPVDGHAVTVSVGIASSPDSLFASIDEMMFAADQALYRAKRGGRNRVEGEKRRERFARQRGVDVNLPFNSVATA
ncbi:MAG TPA: diguanylate cyclase, partial [Thermoanaerobaculia bacterium]